MKAIIKLKGRYEKGAVFSLERTIDAALKRRGITDIQPKVNEAERTIIMPVGLPGVELETILSHVNILHQINYIKDSEDSGNVSIKEKIPQDYAPLKARVKTQDSQIKALDAENKDIKRELKTEKERGSFLQSRLSDMESRYSGMNVQDFLSEIMIRENNVWENFVNSYQEALKTAGELYGIPVEELERECLDYYGLESRVDFKEVKERAEKAREALKFKDFVNVKAAQAAIEEEEEEMLERDKRIEELWGELSIYASGKQIRIALTSGENETILTLPFRKKEEYPKLEKKLVENINQALQEYGLSYSQGDFNGLLRYRVPEMKKRAKNNLIKTISSTEDTFIKLCGRREVVRVESYNA